MKIHISLPAAPLLQNCVVTVGTFDGVHRGHQALVKVLKAHAAQHNLATAVLTFQDMPYCYFRPDDCPRLLTLPEEKIAAFAQLEIDHLFIVPFDEVIANQSYEDFAREVLCGKLGMKTLVAGPDFALGKGRAGTITALQSLGESLGFNVRVLEEKLQETGAPISSTRVRSAVESGAIESAAQMLGRAFSFAGEVVTGKRLGRTIGVPTINLKIHPRKVLPLNGIYAARALFDDGTTHPAALSIGTNPTTDATGEMKIEFHVIGENIEVPPQNARLEVVARLRDEAKFASLEDLVAQMQRDIEVARNILI